MTKPTAIKELSGAYKKDPQRRPKGEPKPRMGIGPAPAWMNEHQKKIWDEYVDIIAPGVLKNMDRMVLELTVRLTEEMRLGEITASKIGNLLACLQKLGMSPVDRQKIQIEQPKAENDWDNI